MKTVRLYYLLIAVILVNLGGCKRSLVRNNYPSGSMEYPDRAITQRTSSYDTAWENGNADARNLDPGKPVYSVTWKVPDGSPTSGLPHPAMNVDFQDLR